MTASLEERQWTRREFVIERGHREKIASRSIEKDKGRSSQSVFWMSFSRQGQS